MRRLRLAAASRRRRRGFTLVEALIALVLTAVVTAGIGLALRTALDASDRMRERSDAHAEARAALQTLSNDIRAAYLSGVNTEQTYFTGAPTDRTGPGQAFLRFTPLSYRRGGGSAAEGQRTRSDALQVEYSLQPTPSAGQTLVRRERWPTEIGAGVTEVVCERIATLRLRYLGADDFDPDWNEGAQGNPPLKVYKGENVSAPRRRLPRAVEITLLLIPPKDAGEAAKPRAYKTLVPVEMEAPAPFQPEEVPPPPPGSEGGDAEEPPGA